MREKEGSCSKRKVGRNGIHFKRKDEIKTKWQNKDKGWSDWHNGKKERKKVGLELEKEDIFEELK